MRELLALGGVYAELWAEQIGLADLHRRPHNADEYSADEYSYSAEPGQGSAGWPV